MVMELLMRATNTTPRKAPKIVPSPPRSDAPPITAAAKTCNSIPLPAVGKWVFGHDRVGQIVSVDLSGAADTYLRQNSKLIIVNATDTPGADTGNGHAYFRQSPSTSSDILATLMFDLKPGERGLEQANGGPIWTFTADYIDRLRTAVVKARSH